MTGGSHGFAHYKVFLVSYSVIALHSLLLLRGNLTFIASSVQQLKDVGKAATVA